MPPCLGLLTVPTWCIIKSLSSPVLCSFPVCVWVPSVARSCATKDANNKDNVCKPKIPAGIKCPPPSKTISPITRFGTISARLAKESYTALELGLWDVRGDTGNSVTQHRTNSPGALNVKAGVKAREHDSRREHSMSREPPGYYFGKRVLLPECSSRCP